MLRSKMTRNRLQRPDIGKINIVKLRNQTYSYLFIWYLRYGIVGTYGTFGTAVIKFAVLMEPLRASRAPYMVRMRHSATR